MSRSSLSLAFVGVVAAVSTVALAGCYNPSSTTCQVHCWDHRPLIVDGNNDGDFDAFCENDGLDATPQTFFPPLPPAGFFLARACTDTQSQHETIKAAIAAIQQQQPLTASQFSTYNDIVDEIADVGVEICVAYLIGDDLSTPNILEREDIDPNTQEVESCTVPDAEALCDTYVRAAIFDDLGEVLGGGNEVPQYSGTGAKSISIGQVCDFAPELGQADTDTDGGSGSATSGADSGDSTGTEADGPWGDLAALVSCNGNNACTLDPALVDNVTANFGVFYTEQVFMTLVTSPGVGAMITGLDRGEDAYDLADAFGIEDGDVITEVDGIVLDSEEATGAVLTHLADGPSPVAFTILRLVNNQKTFIDYQLRLTQ